MKDKINEVKERLPRMTMQGDLQLAPSAKVAESSPCSPQTLCDGRAAWRPAFPAAMVDR
jgi:hypothetical protein